MLNVIWAHARCVFHSSQKSIRVTCSSYLSFNGLAAIIYLRSIQKIGQDEYEKLLLLDKPERKPGYYSQHISRTLPRLFCAYFQRTWEQMAYWVSGHSP